ncbi:hypothetical protein NFB56_16035 [Yersinia ruckeri]|uniref:hypothetical protein n=1 Tax=Yersinia ruckeri TaxID=29486 RepID=UPI0022370ABF|nr:hypothetical protein [Yersinia ruckeri]MCW6550348.1 hypothetical protein [Yersinia ruckeri]
MTLFTDIIAAIEEAEFLRHQTGNHHKIVQRRQGNMKVSMERNSEKEHSMPKMYSTRSPC